MSAETLLKEKERERESLQKIIQIHRPEELTYLNLKCYSRNQGW
jgi:hypothetical protein